VEKETVVMERAGDCCWICCSLIPLLIPTWYTSCVSSWYQ